MGVLSNEKKALDFYGVGHKHFVFLFFSKWPLFLVGGGGRGFNRPHHIMKTLGAFMPYPRVLEIGIFGVWVNEKSPRFLGCGSNILANPCSSTAHASHVTRVNECCRKSEK